MNRLFSCLIALILAGCLSNPKTKCVDPQKTRPPIAVERVRCGVKIPATDMMTNPPVAVFWAEYDNPVCKCDAATGSCAVEVDNLQKFVGELLAESGKIAGAGWGQYTNKIETAEDGVRRVLGNYTKMYEDFMSDADPQNGRISCSWEMILDGRKVWDDSRFVSYRIRCETYFGGAHPDVQFVNGVYDRTTGRRAIAEDLIRCDSLLTVLNLLRSSIARANPESAILKDLANPETRGYEELRHIRKLCEADTAEWSNVPFLTNNFYLDEDGLSWTFDEYELSSYGDGCPEGTVAWDDLDTCLKDPGIIPMRSQRAEFWEKLKNAKRMEQGRLIFF